jgi:hypothetical protein
MTWRLERAPSTRTPGVGEGKALSQSYAWRQPNGPRISCGDSLTAHNPTFLTREASASCMRLLGGGIEKLINQLSQSVRRELIIGSVAG